MTGIEQIELVLHQMGYINIKRWVDYDKKYQMRVSAIEVYCPPLVMDENIAKIKNRFPLFRVIGNSNQSYILIKFL